jgi:endoglucanase
MLHLQRTSHPPAARPLWVDPHTLAGQAVRSLAAAGRRAERDLIARIAETPQAAWFGEWTGEDPSAAVAAYTARAHASGALPVLVAYHRPHRDGGGFSAGGASGAAAYRTWVDRFAAAMNGPAVVIVEPDALAQLDGLAGAEAREAIALVRYAGAAFAARPDVAVYLDAGHSAWLPPPVIAERLTAAGVPGVRGFSLNVSNYRSTADEVAYGSEVSRLLGGGRFVVDTGRNGRGPAADGGWCNPPGRGIGRRPTTNTGHPLVDAYLWIKAPGESDGPCHGGPAAGEFWLEGALALARADGG